MKNNKRTPTITILVSLTLIISVFALIKATQYVRAGANLVQPIHLIDQALTNSQILAQEIALDSRQVSEFVSDHKAEVMGIYALTESEAVVLEACAVGSCYHVIVFDFDENATVATVVDLNSETVVDVYHQPNGHPELNARLFNLAYEIIQNDQDVIDALGFRPDRSLIWVTESNRMDTECDGSHYCVGAVFTLDSGSVWAMVDLNDEEMEKIWWTDRLPDPVLNVYDSPLASETVRGIENCGQVLSVNRDGWSLNYETTPSDSLKVSDITFDTGLGPQAVASSIKLLEWHAHYPGNWGFVDYTGCGVSGGEHGFPIYPFGVTQIIDIVDPDSLEVIGFDVVQDFRMSNWGNSCNYRYEQHFEFYQDGRWRVATRAFGQGCGNDTSQEATYRPVTRIDIAVDGNDDDVFAVWNGSSWNEATTEAWQLQNETMTPEGYDYYVKDTVTENGYFIESGRGQFEDGGTGDNAYIYVTQHKISEGDNDMPSIGPCCTDTHAQGPHNYINGENVDSENIVIWLVPQSKTITTWQATSNPSLEQYCWTDDVNNTWPCASGPMFVPMGAIDEAITGLTAAYDGPASINETMTFSATIQSGNNVVYYWDFDDHGRPQSGPVVTHAFRTGGGGILLQ